MEMLHIMWKWIISIIIVISLSIPLFINSSEIIKSSNSKLDSDYYGYISIPSIEMNLGFYNYDNPLNNVSKNVQLINTGVNNTYLLAAHSGIGNIAYFNDLSKLQLKDNIYLCIDGTNYTYEVVNIRRIPKTGKINISSEENMLYLTTCDQIVKGYQLIIECKNIEKELS